jgi:pimeloyl-ACP methyl ester carboxylesterase
MRHGSMITPAMRRSRSCEADSSSRAAMRPYDTAPTPLLAIIALLLVIGGRTAVAQERVDLPTRPGVTLPVCVTAAPTPKASIILFPGGSGVVVQVRNNFLLRVAPQFVAQGMTVAVIDTPSDHPSGMGAQARATTEHVTDIAAVVAMLKTRSPAPIWLIGTSRGSISAANAAANIGPPRISGLVLSSSVWQGGMASVALDQIRIPVLAVHNRDDGCRESPFSDTATMMGPDASGHRQGTAGRLRRSFAERPLRRSVAARLLHY